MHESQNDEREPLEDHQENNPLKIAMDAVDAGVVELVQALDGAGAKTPARPTMLDIHSVLKERELSHGNYGIIAHTAQAIKGEMRDAGKWPEMSYIEREAAEHIATRLARISGGDPHFRDHWVDIAGYAQLVADRLK
jgi:hypothetical protein